MFQLRPAPSTRHTCKRQINGEVQRAHTVTTHLLACMHKQKAGVPSIRLRTGGGALEEEICPVMCVNESRGGAVTLHLVGLWEL